MKDLDRGKFVFLPFAIALIALWAIVRFVVQVPKNISLNDITIPFWLVLEMPVWLTVGILTAASSKKGEVHNRSGFMKMWVAGGLVGWLVVIILWGVSFAFPGLKVENLGIGIELTQEAPTFWAAIAFLLGNFGMVTLRIPGVAWSQLKKSFFENNAGDSTNGGFWNNLSKMWKGLQGILKPSK